MRMRMAGTKLDDNTDEALTSNGNEESSSLDESISAEEASSLKEEGNELYKKGEYKSAIEKYTKAASSANASEEDRGVYFCNRAAAYLKLQNFEQVEKDTTEALKLKKGYKKALQRRKQARETLKKWRGALEDAKELGASSTEVQRLEMLAKEKEAKDQEEAMESLKGLGNSLLSNFGMSIDDFAMEKDPQTGSYSIKMKNQG